MKITGAEALIKALEMEKVDVMFGYPVTTANGKYEIVQGLEIDACSQEKINITLKELEEERAGVQHLLG